MSILAGLPMDHVDGTLPSTRLASRRRSKFYFGMAVAMSVVVFVGFGPSFYLSAYFAPRLGIIPPVSSWPPLLILHGLVFSSWMVLLMLQTALAARGQVQLHRRLGIAGATLAALVVVVGIAAQRAQTHRMLSTGEFDTNFGLGPGVFFGANLSMILFAALAGAAIYLRRRPETHKRLILLATTAIIGAATSRIAAMSAFGVPAIGPLSGHISLVMTDMFIVALLVFDLRTGGRVHAATLWGGLLIVAAQALSFTPVVGSSVMRELARLVAS